MLRHHLLVLVAALAAPPPPEPSVGVCWTRNRVDVREPKARRGEANRSADALELRNLVLSAGSVRLRHNVSSCLFTDLAAPLLAAAVGELLAAPGAGELRGLRLFDAVLPDGEAAFLAALEARGDGKLAAWARDAGTLVNSRLGRIYNLARAPFDVTLFLDDDTYACAGGLELSLRRLAGLRKGPALRAHPFSSPSTGINPAKLRDVAACAWRGAKDAAKRAGDTVDGASLHAACADAHAKASLWCPGAQGGAILADRRTKGLAKFVDGWLETYVNVYRKYADGDAWKAGGRDGHFGADQYALERLFASSNVCEAKRAAYKLDFGYLPMNFNMRDPPSRHSCDWPLFGATHVIHHKHYVNGGTFAAAARRVDAVCDFLNAPATTPAFVVDKGAKTPRCGWM